ncbi:MAG TPA: helix-hairpin-helix domain-containing protein [Syntrophomonadaceae bacterium]|nr:helix-hairpin-helix domain-containing protein [Syntrophomonadaceae bacterium]
MGNFDKRLVGVMIGILILSFIGGSWYAQKKADKEASQAELITLAEDAEIDPAELLIETTTVVVFVSGAVVKPGIYTLSEGARLYEAIDEAGGLLPEAEIKQIPMARIIEDEETIYIPIIGEEEENPTPSGSGISSNKVNINKADASELATLSGIGPALSQRIIDHRNSNGPFKDISEIQNVSGIGEKKYEALKDSISVK